MKLYEEIGIKDNIGNDIFSGAIIKHNQNHFVIKWSFEQKQYIARDPLSKSWRDFDWIKRLAPKYIRMIGVITDDKWKKYHDFWNRYIEKFLNEQK